MPVLLDGKRQRHHAVIMITGRRGVADTRARVLVLEQLQLGADRPVGESDLTGLNGDSQPFHQFLLGQLL